VVRVPEQLVAFGEQRHQRPQVRVSFGQLSGDLLRAQLGQPRFAPTDLDVERV
jgi:hypothetical protein